MEHLRGFLWIFLKMFSLVFFQDMFLKLLQQLFLNIAQKYVSNFFRASSTIIPGICKSIVILFWKFERKHFIIFLKSIHDYCSSCKNDSKSGGLFLSIPSKIRPAILQITLWAFFTLKFSSAALFWTRLKTTISVSLSLNQLKKALK